MTPYQEPEKLNKRGHAAITKRLIAEHGSVAMPLHGAQRSKTLQSPQLPPGATQAKVKEELVSLSATDFPPRRPTLRKTKSLGDYSHRSDPQNYTAAWAVLNEKLFQPYQPSAVPFQAPTMVLPPPAVPEVPPTMPYQSSATPYTLQQYHINLEQYHVNLRSNSYQPSPVPLICPAVPYRYLNLNEVSGAQNSKSQLQNNDQSKERPEKHQGVPRSIATMPHGCSIIRTISKSPNF
ncbi:hypothetical protein FMEXI_3940 [Fusarium mexicanum]|uniref:Uncharacterized protein n=1 Tax=Fusarium mexicanum TaxID=751941 RepID=A0A8H5JA21_9HYPO|nr:hypothetical protein FMEXI_3940 [Fusarium mexicanum]